MQGSGLSEVSLSFRERTLRSSLPENLGGSGEGPDPHELLEAALTACTILTVQLYAQRKKWKLESTDVTVKITAEGPAGTSISRELSFRGELDEGQRARLLEIAEKCPIHRLLTGKVEITTELKP